MACPNAHKPQSLLAGRRNQGSKVKVESGKPQWKVQKWTAWGEAHLTVLLTETTQVAG